MLLLLNHLNLQGPFKFYSTSKDYFNQVILSNLNSNLYVSTKFNLVKNKLLK